MVIPIQSISEVKPDPPGGNIDKNLYYANQPSARCVVESFNF